MTKAPLQPNEPIEQNARFGVLALSTVESGQDKGVKALSGRKLWMPLSIQHFSGESGRTREVWAPSWFNDFFSHMAACLQSSRWLIMLETLGNETNRARALMSSSVYLSALMF